MKKRLRKKLRLGEFYELVLHVNGVFVGTLDDEQVDRFIDEMCDFVDEIGCTFVGITDCNTFDYHFMGLYKYKNRLTMEQEDKVWHKLDGYGFIKDLNLKVVKTTEIGG